MSEEVKKEFQDRISELEAELAETQKAREAAAAQVTELESKARTQRFEQLIGAGDVAWAGERAVHLQMLQLLADGYGEDSDQFNAYVRQQKALTAQLKDSDLFREMGSSGETPNGRSVAGQIDAKAEKLAEAQGITYEQAYTRVLQQNPRLYADYQKEMEV